MASAPLDEGLERRSSGQSGEVLAAALRAPLHGEAEGQGHNVHGDHGAFSTMPHDRADAGNLHGDLGERRCRGRHVDTCASRGTKTLGLRVLGFRF